MSTFLAPLLANGVLVTLIWLLSLYRQNASLIDLGWSLMFVVATCIWFQPATASFSQWLIAGLIVAWGVRLYIYLAWRNWGEPEDRRYRAIRERNSPGFWWKSYFIVFLLQALLAWIASWSIYGAVQIIHFGPMAFAGLVLTVTGLLFEVIGDWQLAVFRSKPNNRGRVMRQGLWRYTRHPNYFGECCFWWGIYLFAVAAGHWWTLFAPLLITVLLLRVSGVTLLESDISDRRPEYADYVRRTNAFFPGPQKVLREMNL
jgi:steroid 5-alpha reductase family enzyme